MALYVIIGPPAGGKTTWALDHARPSDVVIDYDRLAVALSGPGAATHDHPKHIRRLGWRVRQVAINDALKMTEQCDVYLIHTQPRPHDLARYRAAGAEIVTIDPGHEVVTGRIESERPAYASGIADDWYAAGGEPASTLRDW